MDSGRLLDALGDLAGSEDARQKYAADPDGFLGGYGHSGLPTDLVAEAVSNYADVAGPALAEHIAPMIMVYRGFGDPDATGDPDAGLDVLATAPTADGGGDPANLDGDLAAGSGDRAAGGEAATGGDPLPESATGPGDLLDLDFGFGAEAEAEAEAEPEFGLDADPAGTGSAGSAAMDTEPLGDPDETGLPQHDPAGVHDDQPPDERWPDDAFGLDSL
ncbi:hypothetical protein QTQ03_07775 [Micromonospora sp. WMMA1363]|uniref:hypothetical protein n=1 Tax=Micromonospora sp. WMMA1363 TaxID=3053985 RepID=UPI00259CC899|nr:hypothetical protein [Micromonospora sp. WMMA1363]MDM4719499.1 hypothetical protein [Micromonospora sp. WMMA1363]